MKKKIGIALGVFIGVLGVIVISLPWIIDLNHYRGTIKTLVEKNIHGTFELKQLSFKGLGIRIQGLSLTHSGDFREKNVLSVGEAQVKVSFLSLFSGRPKATLILKNPNITIVKNNAGLLNVATLVKKADSQGEASDQKTDGKKEFKLPGIVLGARLSFLAEQATLRYSDEKSEKKSEVENLNISLQNVALNQPIDFAISAHFSSGSQKAALVDGTLSYSGYARVLTGSGNKISGVELDSKLALGELAIDIKGKVSNFENLKTDFQIKTAELSLAKLKDSFSPLRKVPLDGTLRVEGMVNGPLKDLEACRVDAKVLLNIKSGQTDLSFKTTLKETLSHLKSEFVLEASHLNLDELIPQKSALSLPVLLGAAMAASGETDSLKGIRENPIFRGLTATGKVDIQKLTFRKTPLTELKGDFGLKDLVFSLSRFTMQGFKGKVSAKGDFNVASQKPTYQFATVLQNLEMNSLVSMGSPVLRDTFTGTLNADMTLQGTGITFPEVKTYLAGKGRIEIKDAELKGLNMGKALQEQLKLVSIFAGSDVLSEDLSGKFDYLKSSLIIKGGKLETPNAVLEAPGYGATLQGFVSFDKEINYKGKVLLPAQKFKSRSIASMADSKGRVGFPFELTGVLPKYNFSVDASEVARMAAKSQVQETLKEKVKEKIGIDLPVDLPF